MGLKENGESLELIDGASVLLYETEIVLCVENDKLYTMLPEQSIDETAVVMLYMYVRSSTRRGARWFFTNLQLCEDIKDTTEALAKAKLLWD